MELSSGTITSNSLFKHLFFNELNTITFLMVILMLTFLFTSLVMYLGICSCSITLYMSIMTVYFVYLYILVFYCCICFNNMGN